MPNSFSIIVHDEPVERMLRSLDTALNPVAIAGFLSGVVDPYLRGRAGSRFRNEGDDVVGKWMPLREATQTIRADLGYGAAHPINKRTGELEDYIVNSPNSLNIHPWGASLTLPGKAPSNSELRKKVVTAQAGMDRTVPRPVLGMNERDLTFVLLALAESVKKAVR